MASFAATMARSTGFLESANHLSKLAGAGARPVVLTSHLTVRAAWATTVNNGSSLIIACVGERRDADEGPRLRVVFQMRGQAI